MAVLFSACLGQHRHQRGQSVDGETSAALLRVLAAGRPAVVSDYGQFASLPDDVVLKVPPGEGEVESLVQVIASLLRNREELAKRGESAREWIRTGHRPEEVADRWIEVCRLFLSLGVNVEARGEPALPAAELLPTTLTWRHLPGRIAVRGAEAPWAPGERRRLEIELTNSGRARWLAASRGEGGVVLGFELWTDGVDLAIGERDRKSVV